MGKFFLVAGALALLASSAQAGAQTSTGTGAPSYGDQSRDVPPQMQDRRPGASPDGYIEERFGPDGRSVTVQRPPEMDDGDRPSEDDIRIERAQTATPPVARYVMNTRMLPRGDVIVDPAHHLLYVGVDAVRMRVFPVAVGRRGAAWHGVARVGFKTTNPTWHPTKHMQREKHVASVVRPGPSNPLGVRAIYLFQGGRDTLYRIHGTNQPSSIGKSVSHGCIRMRNSDVVQLYDMVPVGAQVTVL